jgi:uncharacterized membrane-anchored protein
MKNRALIFWLVSLLVFIIFNGMVIQKEWLAAQGQVVFLELAPVDPRSLIQGDYMRLRYAIARAVDRDAGQHDGLIVIQLDENRVAHYVRIYAPQMPLAANELLLRYRQRTNGVSVGPEAYFFQEGAAQYYQAAHYGELRVSAAGEVLLVGLRGENLEALGPP